MSVKPEENKKFRDFVSQIAHESGCFEFKPDQIVWHYTDGPGFLGIIQSSRLYATQVSALNDAKETKYASDLFISAIRRLKEVRVSEPDVVTLLNAVLEHYGANDEFTRDQQILRYLLQW